MTRAALRVKPFSSSKAMIFPALPAPNASGLMIVSVVLPAMNASLGCAGLRPVSCRSVADQLANDVPAGEKADQLALADHGDAVHVLVAHERCNFGDGLFRGHAPHLPGH